MLPKLIHRDMTLPEILGRYPACRHVFDRYGLHGCGGPQGPPETLRFFARAHRGPEDALLEELERAASTVPPAQLEYHPGPADTIYRGFFKAAILTMFTFGCVLGGINLAILAARHQLAALDMRAVIWAHAHAQIAGWVTFFVMGFAYQAIPRFKFTSLWKPRLAQATLYWMAAALVVRALADLWQSNSPWKIAGAVAGAIELAVVITFALVLTQSIRSSREPSEPYEKFLYAALAWMIAGFTFDLWIFVASAAVSGYKEWVAFIGTYDAPWRDIQLLGFAGGMILGVSQRFLPFIYGFREVSRRQSNWVFGLWNLSVIGSIAGYSLLVRKRDALWGIVLLLSIGGLLAAVLLLIRALRLFSVVGRPPRAAAGPPAGSAFGSAETDRSLPFLRAAYAWAVVALAMLLLLPVYNAAAGTVFSHAYFGAYRHAFTVGFISMMIVGVSSKVVPVLGGIDPRRLSSLRVPFWLLNAGNAMRVIFQVLTDSQPWAFPVMAVSAWVEVTGLTWWAVDLWRTMNRRPDLAVPPGDRARAEVAPQTRVFDIISSYPTRHSSGLPPPPDP